MKDIVIETVHALKAHGITSELASGGAGAFTITSGDEPARGSGSICNIPDRHFCTLNAVRSGLQSLVETALPGDRIEVETLWGNQLPFLPQACRDLPGVADEIRAVSDLIDLLQARHVSTVFTATPGEPEPEIIRIASRALMSARTSEAT